MKQTINKDFAWVLPVVKWSHVYHESLELSKWYLRLARMDTENLLHLSYDPEVSDKR